jgi:hypothetical protein
LKGTRQSALYPIGFSHPTNGRNLSERKTSEWMLFASVSWLALSRLESQKQGKKKEGNQGDGAYKSTFGSQKPRMNGKGKKSQEGQERVSTDYLYRESARTDSLYGKWLNPTVEP